MKTEKRYSLLLLAGGKSSRMGKDKAELIYEGKTFMEHMLSIADELGIEKKYISGHCYDGDKAQVVWDEYPGRGPLGGIHACMKAVETPFCLVLPVDVPGVSVRFLKGLLGSHQKSEGRLPMVWRHGCLTEPLIGIYPVSMADAIEELIRDKAAPVFRLLDSWGYECYDRAGDEAPLNVNTPENYEMLVGAAEKAAVHIRRIRSGQVFEAEDVAARELELSIELKSGEKVNAVCTPTHREEFILGRRYLLDDLEMSEYPVQPADELDSIGIDFIMEMAGELYDNPGDLFSTTGCAHSCALVRGGQVLCRMEDIGRHNALDKVVGYALMNGIPIKDSVIFTSGRISKDYLEKVIKAGFGIVVSRAAVTESAIALACRENITMLGFVRKFSGNIYNEGRVALDK